MIQDLIIALDKVANEQGCNGDIVSDRLAEMLNRIVQVLETNLENKERLADEQHKQAMEDVMGGHGQG